MVSISRFVMTVATLVMLSACAASEGSQGNSSEARNQLTAQERSQGWNLLFDGGDLSAWRGFQREDVPAGWSVARDAIHFNPEVEGGGGDLITKKEYGDFALELDWRISKGGNSGIIYRVSEDGEETWKTGPEYQILDNERHPDAENGLDRTAAAVYDLYPPSEDATRPAGQWNQARILVDDGHVEHWLNGVQVASYEWGSAEWKERVAESKFGPMPGFGDNERGHIALQDHAHKVWYRNIKIRPLD